MKKIIAVLALPLIINTVSMQEAFSQARDRPSEGRTSDRTGSSSSTGSSYSSDYSSSGNWGSSGSSSSGSSSSGSSDYSSGSSSSYSGYSYTPRNTSRRAAPAIRDRNYSSPIPNGTVRAAGSYVRRDYYGDVYQPARHRPTGYVRTSPRHRYEPGVYYTRINRVHVYHYWLFEPVGNRYPDGYCYMDEYDYYVYQGYRYRYSDQDFCDYQLVDTESDTVVEEFKGYTCKESYDKCAARRDEVVAQGSWYDPKDHYVCAERVSKEYENTSVSSMPTLTSHLPAATVRQLSDFVKSKKPLKLYKFGAKEGLNKCKIEKLKKNKNKCNYQVVVDGKPYPQQDGSVCSNRDTSAIYGCDTSSQMKNAACLLSLAIMEGNCLNEKGTL